MTCAGSVKPGRVRMKCGIVRNEPHVFVILYDIGYHVLALTRGHFQEKTRCVED